MTQLDREYAAGETGTSSKDNVEILVVDDNHDLLSMLSHGIEASGLKCLIASSTEEGCLMLRTHRITLVLLDWRLVEGGHELTGAELLRTCRTEHPLMPVLVMSGVPLAHMDVRTDAILAQADGFLQKPISITLVVALINRWLQRLAATITLPLCEGEVKTFEGAKRKYVEHVVKLCDGNISLAARKMGFH